LTEIFYPVNLDEVKPRRIIFFDWKKKVKGILLTCSDSLAGTQNRGYFRAGLSEHFTEGIL